MTTPGTHRKVGLAPVIVALVGAVLIGIGVGMYSIPAGFVVTGVEMIVSAYLLAYWRARG